MSTRKTYQEIVFLVRCMYQNNEINREKKQNLMTLVQEGVRCGTYPSPLKEELLVLSRYSNFSNRIHQFLEKEVF